MIHSIVDKQKDLKKQHSFADGPIGHDRHCHGEKFPSKDRSWCPVQKREELHKERAKGRAMH
jgi:hypothetical protein